MKKLITLTIAATLAGCATHADITMPGVTPPSHQAFDNKTIACSILYSQPKPGWFNDFEQLPLMPLESAELSVASAATLRKFPEYVKSQLPTSTAVAGDRQGDFTLVVEMVAHDKRGPAFADHEFAKSLAKNIVTLGFASSEYDITADFDVAYSLYSGKQKVFEKNYKVVDSVDHERGDFDSYSSLNGYAGQLLEKHLTLTLNDFFKQASVAL